MSSLQKIVIFSGGTINYIRPHFALCAPAFGTIGNNIFDAFTEWRDKKFPPELIKEIDAPIAMNQIIHERTKMAGGDSIVTNEDLALVLDGYLADPTVGCIIMAAAVCDFEADSVRSKYGDCEDAGKHLPRLNTSNPDKYYKIAVYPAEKLITKIKEHRPDIFLVGFKTTTDASDDELKEACIKSQTANGGNLIFGNDINLHTNVLISSNVSLTAPRQNCIAAMVGLIMNYLQDNITP